MFDFHSISVIPLLVSYYIGSVLLSFSPVACGTPRLRSKAATWLVCSAVSFLFVLILYPLQTASLALHILIAGALYFILFRLLFKDSRFKCFCMTLYVCAISIAGELVCALFFRRYLELEAYADFTGSNLYMLVGVTFTNMSVLLLTAAVPAVWQIIRLSRHARKFVLYSLFPLYQFLLFCICMSLFEKPSAEMVFVGNIFLLLAILIDLLLMSALNNLFRQKKQQEEYNALVRQQLRELDYYQTVRRQLNQQHIIRHEFANQLSTIYALCYRHAPAQEIEALLQAADDFLKTPPDTDASK